MKNIFFLVFIFFLQTIASEKPTSITTSQVKKLKLLPVSINVVGAAEIHFEASGGVPPYTFSASSGNLFKKKTKAVLSTQDIESTIYVYLKDSTGAKVQSEVVVTPLQKKN